MEVVNVRMRVAICLAVHPSGKRFSFFLISSSAS